MADLPVATDPAAMQPQEAMPVDDGSLTIAITRDAQGSYSVEKESAQEDAAEEGGENPEADLAGATKARDLNDALKIAKSMFEEGDNASAEALFSQGFGGDVAALKKPMM